MDAYVLSRDTDLVIEHLLHRLTASVYFLDEFRAQYHEAQWILPNLKI